MSINTENAKKEESKKKPDDMVKCYISASLTIKDVNTDKVILKKRG